MKKSDLLKLLFSPFRRRSLSRKPELSAMMLESGLIPSGDQKSTDET